ncbi:hypothetical protein MNBD_NITROSPINAE01-327 [hydrothermal vent metagenome]|uniref:Uncharacterized protein n=1 Tax=hydrothermal vent metagenome TaxID=652676 RepID=A0A3B1D1K5_9ZZZZ
MSDLSKINSDMRLTAIKTVLRNHPFLIEKLTKENGAFDTTATPETLDLDDPGDILVRLAWDIWNGGGETELDKVFNQLSEEDFVAFIDGMKDFLALRKKIHFAYVSGMEDD